MLRPERAREMLKEFTDDRLPELRVGRIGGLSPDLRATGWGILRRSAEGAHLDDTKVQSKAQKEAMERLFVLPAGDRLAIFTALFGQIAVHVEAAWQLHSRLPYQTGWGRKAFRAPHTPKSTENSRSIWLQCFLRAMNNFEQDLEWLAAWTPYLGYGHNDYLGVLFAAAIDAGGSEGDRIYDILAASARGDHPIGAMGRHVSRALLVASRPEGWELIEKLLVAAQRQEGLRQVVLETIDEAHPEAFRRMLRLILKENLARFSATIRAVDVWFGSGWTAEDAKLVNRTIATVLGFLDAPESRLEAQENGTAEAAYYSLWADAFDDAFAAVEPARRLLQHEDPERRFAAAHLLAQDILIASENALLPALDDPDLRVAVRAASVFQRGINTERNESDLFERLERLLGRLPAKPTALKPILWPWMVLMADRQAVAGSLKACLGSRSPKRLLPYLSMMPSWDKLRVAEQLAAAETWDAETRETLFALVGDADSYVRTGALKALRNCTVEPGEARGMEKLLTRKAGDLRRGVFSLLLNQPDEAALESAKRLVDASNPLQRVAGLELLREMIDRGRMAEACREQARQIRSSSRRPLRNAGEELLDRLLDVERDVPTLDNALGLMDPADRSPVIPPQAIPGLLMVTDAAAQCLQSLDNLIGSLGEEPVTLESGDHTRTELLGNVRYGFPTPNPHLPPDEDIQRLPLWSAWEEWYQGRDELMRDPDGLELVRAAAVLYHARIVF